MDDLLENIKLHNKYVMDKISQIMELDIWYENTKGVPFPKEWYEFVNGSDENQA